MSRRCRAAALAAVLPLALALVVGCGGPQVYAPMEDLVRAEEVAGLVAEGSVLGTMVAAHRLARPIRAASGAVMVRPCTADVRSVLQVERVVKGTGPKEGDALAFGFWCRCQHNATDTFSQIFRLPVRPGERVRVYLVKQGEVWRLIAHSPPVEEPKEPPGAPEESPPKEEAGPGEAP
jgi:hypothetical protein